MTHEGFAQVGRVFRQALAGMDDEAPDAVGIHVPDLGKQLFFFKGVVPEPEGKEGPVVAGLP